MSLPNKRILVIVLAALAVATYGVLRLTAPSDAAPESDSATVDSLTAQVLSASWADMDHDMSGNAPGYQMPPAMMPGMPQNGDQRLGVAVTVVNTSDQTRPLHPTEEFVLRTSKDDKQWTARTDTFSDLPRLAPGNAVKGMLFFDLPPAALADSPAWIEWTHGDTANRLTLPMDGVSSGPGHSHNP
jgi:Domain of unknown function (DUF4352)